MSFSLFYGLEKRLLQEVAYQDLPVIAAEVERLLGIYSSNGSFSRYATNLLNAVVALDSTEDQLAQPVLSPVTTYELPFRVLLGLGRRLTEKQPITADWLLAWCLGSPNLYLRTPAKRAFPELVSLFRRRFQNQYPKGVPLRTPRGRIPPLTYQAASSEFAVIVPGPYTQWPSVARLTVPVQEGITIIQQCTDALEPYSRFLGHNPEATGTIAAQLLLPQELWEDQNHISAVRQWLEQEQNKTGHTVVTWRVLLTRLDLIQGDGEKIARPILRQAGEILERLNTGMEPDCRFDSRTPTSLDEPVVLFPLIEPVAPGPGFAAEALMLAINALVIHADNQVTPEEEAALLALAASRALPPNDQARLLAHAHWLLRLPPKISRLKSRLAELAPATRESLVRHVVAMAGADGTVDPREIEVLKQLYRFLGLESKRLYDDLHELGAADGPITVRPAQSVAPGIPIPPPPAGGVVLDLERIKRIRADTEQVASLLTAIFADNEASPPASQETPVPVFSGLDTPHATLLHRLQQAGTWSMADFHQLCRSLGLLPDGAMEAINEWAYARFDEPLLEDGDHLTLTLNLALLTEGVSP